MKDRVQCWIMPAAGRPQGIAPTMLRSQAKSSYPWVEQLHCITLFISFASRVLRRRTKGEKILGISYPLDRVPLIYEVMSVVLLLTNEILVYTILDIQRHFMKGSYDHPLVCTRITFFSTDVGLCHPALF